MTKKTTDVTKIKLQLGNRIHIGHILPEKGALGTMLTRKGIIDKVQVLRKDMDAVDWQDLENGTATWDAEKDNGRLFSFTGLETELIVRQLRKLNEDEALIPPHVELWALFVEKPEA